MTRVAILGAGIGAAHLEGYAALPDAFSVQCIVDRDIDKARALVRGTNTTVTGEIDAALNDPQVDLVDICLPPHLHVPVTLAALTKGKHVICEKPISTSLTDVARVRDAARQSRRSVYPVFQYRFGPGFAQLRHLVQSGATGHPIVASAETHWSRGADYYTVPWRGTWDGEQGGAVLGHAIHSHDLLVHFFGAIAEVAASVTTRVNDIETEDCAAILLRFRSGALATSNVTLGAAKDETRLRFVFEHLTATSGTNPYAPATDVWSFVARNPADQARFDTIATQASAEPAGFEGFLRAIADDLAGRKSAVVTFEDGAASIELVTAIYHAARTGATVKLPLSQEHPLYSGWRP